MKPLRGDSPTRAAVESIAGPISLFTAVITAEGAPLLCETMVAPLTQREICRLREKALGLVARYGARAKIEMACISSEATKACLKPLLDARGIEINIRYVDAPGGTRPQTSTATEAVKSDDQLPGKPSADPFGMDPQVRRRCVELAQPFFGGQRLVIVRGKDFLPRSGPVLVVARTKAALCWSAIALSATFELPHVAGRPLRVIYERRLAEYPGVAAVCAALGGVPSSFTNARHLLEQGEAVCLLSPIERSPSESGSAESSRRCDLQAARLGLLTRSPIVPATMRMLGKHDQLPGAPGWLGSPSGQQRDSWLSHLGSCIWLLLLPYRLEITFMPPIVPPQSPGQTVQELTGELAKRLNEALS